MSSNERNGRLKHKSHSLDYYCTRNLSFHQNNIEYLTGNFLVSEYFVYSWCEYIHISRIQTMACLLTPPCSYDVSKRGRTVPLCKYKESIQVQRFDSLIINRFMNKLLFCFQPGQYWCQVGPQTHFSMCFILGPRPVLSSRQQQTFVYIVT